MKTTIKIIIIIATIVAIYLLIKNIVTVHVEAPMETASIVNPFNKRIDGRLDSLSKIKDYAFYDILYREIKNEIILYKNNTKFDSIISQNNKIADNKLQHLDFIYFTKFVEQVYKVFNSSEWEAKDLTLIRNEVNMLNDSPYLDADGKAQLKDITDIINHYYKVKLKIANITNYFSNDSFNFSISKQYLEEASELRRTGLGNRYVNNITSFHLTLRDIPVKAYAIHINYVKNKAALNSGKYTGSFEGKCWIEKASNYRSVVYDATTMIINELIDNATLYGVSESEVYSDLRDVRKHWGTNTAEDELQKAISYLKSKYPCN
jgi:hypothetical protein